ncbi:MAG TPA: efflux RND transporter permease subunit [Steroidobacteraceae bacterium]|nr:efflux RND transporter permease subunit [Steroidobacteraceae bacterium]
MKNISAWAIRHPVLPMVLFAVLLFAGTVAFIRLPVTLNPPIAFPVVTVNISQPGAAPEEVETQIVRRVEAAVASINDIDHIYSTAREGAADVTVQFRIGTPIDRAVADVRNVVTQVQVDLPPDIQPPIVQQMRVDGGPIVYYDVSAPGMTPQAVSWFIDNTITKRLLTVPGVAQVSRFGGVDRQVRVELDPARMQALGITAAQVNDQLRDLNIDLPGGQADLGNGEQLIRVLGGADTVRQLADTQIVLPGGRYARLGDIADVRDGAAEVRSLDLFNGRPAIAFGVFQAKGASDVAVLNGIEEALAKIRKQYPAVAINMTFTTVTYTKENYHSAMSALIEGSILAVLMVWLFLRDVRATLISALAIPLSAIPTFAFMQWIGFSLNQVSLLALSLVSGVLVDDAIVEIENIVRHKRMGKSAFQAALDAADQIGLAVIATSATIIAVFLPVSFMGGIIGQYFKQFGLTVAAAVFFSLLVARLLTPVIAAYGLKSDLAHHDGDGPIMTRYLAVLRWCVRHRWKTIGCGILFFAVSVAALMLMPKSFIPDSDSANTALHIELPPGVNLADTRKAADAAYRMVASQPEVTSVDESVGDNGSLNIANLYITLLPHDKRSVSQKEWQERMLGLLKGIPDARMYFQTQNGDSDGHAITIDLTGEDLALLSRTARTVMEQMRQLPGIVDVGSEDDLPQPEILIRPRLDLAARLGVTVASISDTIRIATLGDLVQNDAKFTLPDRQVPILVSLRNSARQDLSTLENLPVPTSSGGTVPLKAVADVRFGQGPTSIHSRDQSLRVAIDADLNGIQLGTAMQEIDAVPALKHLPQGVRLVETGNARLMSELFTDFGIAMATGILMVFAVLVLLFVRVLQPITILSSLPLSLGGAVLALWLTHEPLSLGVMIGFLMLMGIVAKNAILLADFAIEEMRAGKDRLTALLESGHKRARPIVMTTVAMVAGMLPVALAVGDEFRAPMAIAVIGGLITSTALTLIIVPAGFTLIDDIERWVGPKVSRVLIAEPGTVQGAHIGAHGAQT